LHSGDVIISLLDHGLQLRDDLVPILDHGINLLVFLFQVIVIIDQVISLANGILLCLVFLFNLRLQFLDLGIGLRLLLEDLELVLEVVDATCFQVKDTSLVLRRPELLYILARRIIFLPQLVQFFLELFHLVQ